ncbi:hypothetical protein [Actinomadura macra]|nr:hypothetical protein [Actinomadura macra]
MWERLSCAEHSDAAEGACGHAVDTDAIVIVVDDALDFVDEREKF